MARLAFFSKSWCGLGGPSISLVSGFGNLEDGSGQVRANLCSTAPRAAALVAVVLLAGACHGPAAPANHEVGRAEERAPADRPRPPSGINAVSAPDWAEELLKAHNRWRHRYGTKALIWSSELAAHAQEWADHLAASGMKLKHRRPNPYGENLYWSRGKERTPDEVVDAWGSEESLYDAAANNWWPEAGHFSQLVWHSTRRLGCGIARSGDQEFWVCNYDPRGNLQGHRPY